MTAVTSAGKAQRTWDPDFCGMFNEADVDGFGCAREKREKDNKEKSGLLNSWKNLTAWVEEHHGWAKNPDDGRLHEARIVMPQGSGGTHTTSACGGPDTGSGVLAMPAGRRDPEHVARLLRHPVIRVEAHFGDPSIRHPLAGSFSGPPPATHAKMPEARGAGEPPQESGRKDEMGERRRAVRTRMLDQPNPSDGAKGRPRLSREREKERQRRIAGILRQARRLTEEDR